MDKDGQTVLTDKMVYELKDIVGSLSVHGLPRTATSKTRFGKFFWLLVSIGSFVVFIMTSIKLVVKYYKSEIYIKVTTKIDEDIVFPAVTICNTNNIDFSGKLYNDEQFPNTCDISKFNGKVSMLNNKSFLKGCSMFLSYLPHTCRFNKDIDCRFPNYFQPCKSFSPCFTFNGDGSLRQKMIGKRFGLSAILFVNASDHTKFSAFSQYAQITSDVRQGIQVYVHSKYIYPINPEGEAITAPPGFHTEISLRMVVRTRRESPYPTKCSKTGNSIYKKLFPGNYTYHNCIFSCFQLKVYKVCGDVAQYARVWMPTDKFPRRRNVSVTQLKRCIGNMMKSSTLGLDCDCPLPCFELTYRPIVSRNPWPQSWQVDEYSSNFSGAMNISFSAINETYFRRNFVRLSVFFEEFTYEEIAEEALYDRSSLSSDIGGLMGLLLGASSISVIELVWLVGVAIHKRFQSKKCNDCATRRIEVKSCET